MNMKKILVIIACCLLFGCNTRDTEMTNNEVVLDKGVKLLFEYDGIKVYRFCDNGRYVYFTKDAGKIEYTRTYRSGKTTYSEKVQTLCN